MISLEGIWKDSTFRQQPKGFSPDVRNMIISKLLGAYTNEPGFDLWSTYLFDNSLTPVGIVSVNGGRKIVLSVTEDNLSEIGSFDINATYTQVLKYDLGFNANYPMDIEYEYDFMDNLVIAFTDNLNTPKVINLDNLPSPFSIPRIEMFPSAKEVKIASEVVDNFGNLLSGTYYPVFKYKNFDNSESGWSEVGNPVYITNSNINSSFTDYDGCAAGTATTKGIQFTITNGDSNYDKIVLGIIYKNAGVLTVYEMGEQIVGSDPIIVNFTDISNGTADTLSDILTQNAFYNRIQHLTQTNGILYGANVGQTTPLNLQQYANLITLQWKSEIQTAPLALLTSYKVNDQNNKTKGFMHEEVYAFYIRFKLLKGGWTDAFHIPGRGIEVVDGKSWNDDANFSDIAAFDSSFQTDLTISATSKYFQTRDTTRNIVSIDGAGGTGDFGYWENEDETYPNLAMFNSSGIGGEDLRGKKVRHFRFPTIRKLQADLYSGYVNYCLNQLDRLSVQINNFPTLPDDIAAQIEGYEILYAVRNAANSTVAAQDLVICGASRVADTGPANQKNAWSTAGNWCNHEIGGGETPQSSKEHLDSNGYYLRFHAFDLMVNKPAVGVSYISNQVLLNKVNNGYIETGPSEWDFQLDYTVDNSTVTIDALTNPNELLFAVKNFQYVPNNVISGKIINLNCEACIFAELIYGDNRIDFPINGMHFGSNNNSLDHETTYLTNLMVYKRNIYDSFYNQPLVSTGTYFLLSDSLTPIFGGDTFISESGFVTYGPRTTRDTPISPFPYEEPISYTAWGVKVVRAFICESYSNIGFRYESISNQYSKYYPKEPIAGGQAWFLGWDVRTDWNQIQYNTDYSSVNDLNPTQPFNPYSQFISEFPNRLIRCAPSNNEARNVSWRIFLANDYFELQKNRGVITNIQGTAENYVLINTQYSLFKTVGTEELQTDEFKVVLGTGDIFARPPSESDNDEHGYAGCQHKYSCLLTNFGYFFADQDKKKVYLTGKNLEVVDITTGLVNYFNDNMLNEGDNPYQNLGYTVSWDQRYKRILFSQVGTTNPFTYSFTPENKTWTSQHDYIPNVFFNERNSIYSLIEGKIFKHNSLTTRGIYYTDTIYPSYIVQIFNSARPEYAYSKEYKPDSINKKQELFFNISWKTEVLLNNAKQRDLTLDKILIWNSYQATDEQRVVPFDTSLSLLQNKDVANTRRIKDMWMFNSMRDVVIDNTQPFVVNSQIQSGNINNDKSFELKKRFSDDFLAVKFLFSNEKISTLQPECNLIDTAVNFNPVTR